MMITPRNRYTQMQLAHYETEGTTGNMNAGNHSNHNSNPDYEGILIADVIGGAFENKRGLDFGCGCGRNVQNTVKYFSIMDGVDISPTLVSQARENLLKDGYNDSRCNFYACDGVSLGCIPSSTYDFVMSTIVLQHICVYEIRLGYLREFFRVMKHGGSLLSIQMGFGPGHYSSVGYYDNNYDAASTNSGCDTRVDSPDQIVKDLENVGFSSVHFKISHPWEDGHQNWIYVKAVKD